MQSNTVRQMKWEKWDFYFQLRLQFFFDIRCHLNKSYPISSALSFSRIYSSLSFSYLVKVKLTAIWLVNGHHSETMLRTKYCSCSLIKIQCSLLSLSFVCRQFYFFILTVSESTPLSIFQADASIRNPSKQE